MTRLGNLWKFLVTNLPKKVAKLYGDFFWLEWKTSFISLNCCCQFLGYNWKNFGYFLYQHLVTLFIWQNKFYSIGTRNERIVYTVSQVIIIYDRLNETQRHYLGKNPPMTSLYIISVTLTYNTKADRLFFICGYIFYIQRQNLAKSQSRASLVG